MKSYFLLLSVIVLFSYKTVQKTQPNWLVSEWERINEKPGEGIYAFWNKYLTALGFTLKEPETIFNKIMSMISIEDIRQLKFESVNDHPNLFKFTQQKDTSFICENQENQFPKTIHYILDKQ